MRITDWPLYERPRERLLAQGAQALSDAELIAIILRKGVKGFTALDIARELLQNNKGVRGLFNASPAELCKTNGFTAQTYAHLQAVKELGKRYMQENILKDTKVLNTAAIKNFFYAKLHDYAHEVFACLFLDTRHHLIKFEELFHGTLDQTSVHPREVIKQSLFYNAAAVVIAHNHPSGEVMPSSADLAITKHLKEALAWVDIKLLDHIIVGKTAISCYERGYI